MNFRGLFLSGLVLLTTSFDLQAKIYSSPILTEAQNLLVNQPERTLTITQNYLKNRRLSQPQDPSRVHLNGEADHSTRTPLNTINALQIQAQALSLLQRPERAISVIKKAEKTALDNKFMFSVFESRILLAQFYWVNLSNSATALKMLNTLNVDMKHAQPITLTRQLQELKYKSLMLRARIESSIGKDEAAEKLFIKAKGYLVAFDDKDETINYQITLGQHYLRHDHYDMALDRLLSGYWLAVENDDQPQIARANYELAQLFEERHVFDKALEHATQAGEFFERYKRTQQLAKTLSLIASIYEQQGRYNLALVHYFNALDQENQLKHDLRSASLRLNIARVYLHLNNYKKAEQYIEQARNLSLQSGNENIVAESQIMQGQLELEKGELDDAITSLQAGLISASRIGATSLQLMGESVLSEAFEKQNDYYNALLSQRRYEQLYAGKQKSVIKSNTEVFKQQQKMMERSLKLEEMEREQFINQNALYKQQQISLTLIGVLIIMLLLLWRRQHINKQLKQQLTTLTTDYYTHPRSGLRNLRMLNARLANSLQQSSANFEQWHLGEIINEPLSDRLRFALFEVSFLKRIYLEKGYQQGLTAEKEFGNYLQAQVLEPARIYHFSDALFLYIEPNSRLSCDPKQLAESIQQLIDNYTLPLNIDNALQIGMAEYPFLPRAYTAINDQELIDILLMTVDAGVSLNDKQPGSNWVHLCAIDAAPAASFVSDNIRRSCVEGIDKGLVKVRSSTNNEIIWNYDHNLNKDIS
ncbi:GGDEF domain-containing protein [Photobacterium phosphoreum]|uniref:GGDEF domain-containing protein n=1 Tax=Photobacterium phosphoreum TaxID=659 RepID=A0A2T3JGZ4_PHOPO|nr:tetratricopeptide repeat protein [Photobacterium phosphoreum]PSU22238.1 GGDEF domain-containing protein [Photobacterium phosphoreum]PSU41153.1 GGDEF domain-containing protein [Photobacterium phosphoreum]PSU48229.1 GGDEF domain-containing protein [Photobacterium phosphoreum]PSU81067.1 GGDEF domain-containing protein [Photobacterium phosphoreum]